ncbi:MAG: hypothetical protein CM1200mP40_14570 [Gammaproteobacteria bacterium]|nr:MAG: hypothetical protein CM1200mP40_14570 [Gammaproteobacteria bacterium]
MSEARYIQSAKQPLSEPFKQGKIRRVIPQSIESPKEFWAEQAGELLHWHEPWKQSCIGI